MNLLGSIIYLFLMFPTLDQCRGGEGRDIPVMVSGLQPGKGQIVLDLYKDRGSYEERKPFRQIVVDKGSVKDGCLTIFVQLEEGAYGISLVDQAPGASTAGYGFSNCYPPKSKRPTFDDIKIIVKNKNDIFYGTVPVDIRVKYR